MTKYINHSAWSVESKARVGIIKVKEGGVRGEATGRGGGKGEVKEALRGGEGMKGQLGVVSKVAKREE